MIPQRIKLKGFLCYKDEQAIDFDGNATLWMLSGLNGSGKSAIFDAVTYALFGHHRGGATYAVELINKESDTLVVEFDFLLDTKPFRIKRTLKRDNRGGAKGTQQIFRFEKTNTDETNWIAIEGTGAKNDFALWISDNLGLNYETFTSSVLLLQGKSEKLLDSTPAGRREVLARIVDIGRYEKLFQKADDSRKSLEGALKRVTAQLEAVPVVQPLELVEARNRIIDAEESRKSARENIELLKSAEFQVKAWQDLQIQIAAARTRVSRAKDVLAQASTIEQAVRRLRELREIYPKLNEIVLRRADSHNAEEQIKYRDREREKQVEELDFKQSELKRAKDRRDRHLAQITKEETELREVTAGLKEATRQLDKLQECERQENDLQRVRNELTKLPADPATLLDIAREETEKLEALSREVPVLVRFQTRRKDLSQAVTHVQNCETELKEVELNGKTLKSKVDELRPRRDVVTQKLQQAKERHTEARTLLNQARESLREVEQLDGAKTCRHCGQSLTAGHIEEETRRRTEAVKNGEQRVKQTHSEVEKLQEQEQHLSDALATAEKEYQDARDHYRDVQNQLKSARTQIEQLQQDCTHIYAELSSELQSKISKRSEKDWLKTQYPTTEDIDSLNVRLRDLVPSRNRRREAEQTLQRYNQLKAQESTTLNNLNRHLLDLPNDREMLRKTHTDLDLKQKALYKSIDAARKQVKEVDKEIDRFTHERDQAQLALNNTDRLLTDQRLIRQNADRIIEQQMKQLPENWHQQATIIGLNQLHVLAAELKKLETDNTDEQGRQLEHAKHNLTLLEEELKKHEIKEQEFPPEAKEDPTVIANRLKDARRRDQECDALLTDAQKQLALLENYENQRQQLDEEYKQIDKELLSQKLLAELLGKDRLQLYLVRQAERQVVEYANAVLDRLSGGQLYLKLAGAAEGEDSSGKALELEAYNRSTGEKPINVTFLSGSQKFRVAVSLALGIGQYASRQHRPIESVIIDEGFGCLDSQGRQVMIQELQNLRSQMRCILLVSHQEDFAEAFSDGYQFRLENGATRVARIQR